MTPVSWDDIGGGLRGDARYTALALFLSTFADKETGQLPKPPKTLLWNIFGNKYWGKINNAVDQMRTRGLLTNNNPARGRAGEWYVHLPQGITPGAESNVVLIQTAQEFVR